MPTWTAAPTRASAQSARKITSAVHAVARASSRIISEGLFADHDCWRVGVASRDCGYDRGVNDPQPRHTAYPQPRIDDRLLIRSHAAGADRMQIGDAISADGNLKLFVGIDSSA